MRAPNATGEAPANDASRSSEVLIIDDEKNIRTTLTAFLESIGCRALSASTGDEALALLERRGFDLVLLDLKLGNQDGLDLLPKLLAIRPSLAVVIVTAHASIDTAVRAIRLGAVDYLPKPFSPDQVRLCIERVTDRKRLDQTLRDLETRLAEAIPEIRLETSSPRMAAVLEMVGRVAPSEAPVLLTGESGTGKGVLARWIHVRSSRSRKPFVVINCPTLSDELLASELFGHTRGAFTGAVRDQPGRVEAAEGGTLFLDEVGEISPGLQAKLLRFLQEKEFERIGEGRTRRADVRIVAATNRDLEREVREGRFREDLFYRLNVLEICVPPLRDRVADIVPMALDFLRFFAQSGRRDRLVFSPSAKRALENYRWPGNVRELRNTMERTVILWSADTIEPAAFAGRIVAEVSPSATAPEGDTPALGGRWTLDEIEAEHIRRVLARTPTLEEAAQVLGIEPSTLWRKRKKIGPKQPE